MTNSFCLFFPTFLGKAEDALGVLEGGTGITTTYSIPATRGFNCYFFTELFFCCLEYNCYYSYYYYYHCSPCQPSMLSSSSAPSPLQSFRHLFPFRWSVTPGISLSQNKCLLAVVNAGPYCSSTSLSKAPTVMPIKSVASFRQKRKLPHAEQKPRAYPVVA